MGFRSRIAALVLCSTLTAIGCSSKDEPPVPAAPADLTAVAGNQQVTLSWESSAGATGYTVFYNPDSQGAVTPGGSLQIDAGSALFLSVAGLVNGTLYRFAVAARDPTGLGPLSGEITATPQTNVPIAVAATSPAAGATGVSPGAPLSVTFNRAAQVASIAGQPSAGACSGTLQVSSDDFNSCVALGGATANAANTTFTFQPVSPLAASTSYLLRVTTGAKDANGLAMSAQFTLATPFTTAAALAVVAVSPADGATLVPLNSAVTVTLSQAITASTATGNGGAATCAGSFRLYAGSLGGACLALSGVAVNSAGTAVTLTPASPLPPGSLILTEVTTGLQDASGNPLGSNYSSAGFTTVPPLAVASVSPDGKTGVDFQPTLTVAFASPAAPASITTNIAGSTACSGSIQLSKQSDGFAANSCVPMAAQPASGDGGTTFTLAPASRLASSTTYLIRVTTAAQDPSGSPVAQTYTSSGFTTRAFAVVSVSPADGATIARNQAFVITFNRPVSSASLGTGSCAGPFQLEQSGASGCTALQTPTPSQDGTQVALIPAALLNGSVNYSLGVTTALRDDSNQPLGAAFSTSAGYTTAPALAVLSTQPAGGATDVPPNTNLTVVFNQPVAAASATTSSPSCGSVQLTVTGQSSCLASSQALSADGKTLTLTPSALATSTGYTLRLTTALTDATGAPLPSSFSLSFTTGTVLDTAPPGEVGGVQVNAALQSLALSWTNPGDGDFSKVRVHQCASAQSCSNNAGANPVVAEIPGAPNAQASATLSGLAPQTAYTLLLTTVDSSGNESAGSPDTTVNATTAFSGLQGRALSDFTAGQQALAAGAGNAGNSVSVWFTWDANNLYAAIGDSDGSALLATNQDVFWIAVDTDPDADAAGEWRTPTVGSNEIIWPFKADYVVQFIPDSFSSSVQVRAAGGCALIQPANGAIASGCANAAGANTFDGSSGTVNGLAELSIPGAALGGTLPSKIRLAFAAVNSSNGYAYALAPSNPKAIDVLGYFASSTASFNTGVNIWNSTKSASAATSAVSPLPQAAALVTLSVAASPALAAAPPLKGSLHPLSYTEANTFALRDDGTGGDATAGDGIYSGAFNFGAVTQSLFFKFAAGAQGSSTDEFPSGTDRVWTLGGATESLPQLLLGTAYSKNHSFQLTFNVTNPGGSSAQKAVLGNVGELGNFSDSSPAVLTSQGNGAWTTGPITFANHDFTAAMLQWKARDIGSNTWEDSAPNGGPQNHEMNDDVLNSRTLSWTWDDYSQDPF